MARARKGLSYVLGDASDTENHILPINAMQFLLARQQLYTAGRDGAVKIWSADQKESDSEFDFSSNKNLPHEDLQDIAETVLRLETSISSSPLGYSVPRSAYRSNVSKTYNVHFDWVNDLKLVNNDRHLVSASADLSLKLIDIDGDERDVQKFLNVHTDYIKKISSTPLQNQLVSGGLDGKIVVWDMNRLDPILSFENNSTGLNLTSSIYALSNDNAHLISTGGPNNTINLYDRRISTDANANLIRKLVGHQDNVRCLLMNSHYILSGSSDSTIKLWDLRNFNVYKNFDAHDDAVWSLCTAASSDPNLNSSSIGDFKEFFSGDKAGNIIKTDLNYLSTHSNYAEDNAFLNSTFSSSDQAYIDESIGLCTLVAKAPSPIVSVCVEENFSVFASCYDSLKRFHIPETRNLAKYQYLRACVDHIECLDRKFDDDLSKGMESATQKSDLDSDFYDIISHLSAESNKPDIASSLSGISRAVPIPAPEMDSSDSQYTSMFLSVDGGPSPEYVNAYKDSEGSDNGHMALQLFVDETPVEMLLNPLPPDRVLTIPFNKIPFQEFMITPRSIISKKMFNNKRHLISLYANGDIKIWDIFICKVIELIRFEKSSRHLSAEELKIRSKEMEHIYHQRQTQEVLNNWCDVHIRSGKLLVTLSESSICNTEIYYDELVREYPFLKAGTRLKKSNTVLDDTRFFLARIFLASLFQNYSSFELESDRDLRERMRHCKSKPRISLPKHDLSSTDEEDTSMRKKIFSKMSGSIITSSGSTTSSSNEQTEGYNCERLPSSVPEDSIAKMLTFNEHLYKEKYASQGHKRLIDSLLKLYIKDGVLKEGGEDEYRPIIPASLFPSDLLIIIYETSTDLGNFRDLCSFHLSDLKRLENCDFVAENLLVDQLRINVPKWIGAPILYNKFPVKEHPKISFQLFEIDYEALPADRRIGGKTQKKIKKLPSMETSIKLSSHCMLRVSKILQFLTEKFESRTTEMKLKVPATQWLVLECKGQELDNKMTLQTIKTMIWKSSTDIELYFHRKFDSI